MRFVDVSLHRLVVNASGHSIKAKDIKGLGPELDRRALCAAADKSTEARFLWLRPTEKRVIFGEGISQKGGL